MVTFRRAMIAVGVIAVAATTLPIRIPAEPLRNRAMFGAYVSDLPYGRTQLPRLENQLSYKLDIASSFVDWSYVFGNVNDTWMSDGGARQVLYSWEPNALRFTDVTSGAEDSY